MYVFCGDSTTKGLLEHGLCVHLSFSSSTSSLICHTQVRKLEFLFADAISRGCDTVFTCGSQNSNHCRATSVAAREIGLGCYLFLRMKNDVVSEVFVVCEVALDYISILVVNININPKPTIQ